jgi:hypothetical protein
MKTVFATAAAIALFTGTAFAGELLGSVAAVEMTSTEMQKVQGELVGPIAVIDVVDVNNNDVLNNLKVAVPVGACVNVLGACGIAQGVNQPGRQGTGRP